MGNVIVLSILAVLCFLILRSLVQKRKNGSGCTGDCTTCGSSCSVDWNQIRKDMHEQA